VGTSSHVAPFRQFFPIRRGLVKMTVPEKREEGGEKRQKKEEHKEEKKQKGRKKKGKTNINVRQSQTRVRLGGRT